MTELQIKPPDPERNWVVTLHSFYGSMLEGATPERCFGLFNEKDAKIIVQHINLSIRESGEDRIAQAFPVDVYPTNVRFDSADPALFDALVE